jgi:Uma2 family endonuclease
MFTLAVLTEDAMLVKGPPQGQWASSDWEELDHGDGTRYEIIEGVLYVSKSPSMPHQWIVASLFGVLGNPAKNSRLAYSFIAPFGVFMPGCDPVQPDFVLVLKERADAERLIRERGLYGVPDVIVEVLSPGNASYDTDVKMRAYARAGVPEYAIIDPETRTLRYHRLANEGEYAPALEFDGAQSFAFKCLPQFSFLIGDLFAGMPGID